MNRNIKVFILIGLLCILTVIGYFVYTKFIKKDMGVISRGSDNITYIMMQSDTIGSVVSSGEKLFINYPKVTFDNDKINELNNLILDNVSNNIKEITNYSTYSSNELCEKVKLVDSDEVSSFEYLIYNKYYVYDSSKYISIIEMKNYRTSCNISYVDIVNTYVVDKNNQDVLYNNDLVKMVDKELLKRVIDDSSLNDIIDNNDFYVYYDFNNDLIVLFKDDNYNFYVEKDGSYVKEEVNLLFN